MIIIINGEPGTGKSNKSGEFKEPIEVLNLEDNETDIDNRWKSLIKNKLSDRVIVVHHLVKIHTKDEMLGKIKKNAYDINGVESLKAFQIKIKEIMNSNPADYPATVVIDGISDLRNFGHEKWCFDNGREHAVNPGDWEEVNDYVRSILRPFVQFCKNKGIDLIMTAQMKDNYIVIKEKDKQGREVLKSVKSGRTPFYKEWEAYGTTHLIELQQEMDINKRPTGKYYAVCIKSPVGVWTENITNKSVFDMIKEKERT